MYLIYLRKSRADAEAEARGEGETLARHEKTLLELAKAQKLDVTEIYREIVSGETIVARPVMQQLLSEVEQGLWTGVIVMEIERLARGSTLDQGMVAQTFKYSNTKIITPIKTYDPGDTSDEEFFEFSLFMSRREYKTINRRLQAGRLASVKEGKYVGNRAPFGYARVKLENQKGFTLEPTDKADVVRKIYEWYTVGEQQPDGTLKRLGASLIVRRLNALGIPAQINSYWSVSSVRDILINPVYAGKIRWNWRPANKKMIGGQICIERPRKYNYVLINGLHSAIIDEETFYLAQDLMKTNPPRPVGEKHSVTNPLSGLIVCGKCGHKMVRRPYRRSQAPSLICQYTNCDNISSAFHYVEKQVLKSLGEWLKEYKVQLGKVKPFTKTNLHEKALKNLDDEKAVLDKQIDNLHNLLEQGVYDIQKFLERTKVLNDRLKQIEKDKAGIEKAIQAEKRNDEARHNIIPKVEYILTVYNDLDAKGKNDLLKEVLDKVVYVKNTNGRWHNRPDDFETTLYPKLPKI